MREFTPPPTPPPGGDPPPPSSIAVNVSVRFARCSDPGGGTVATWPSLTGSGSASVLIAQDMDDGWDSTPLYYRDAEDYRIFVWHPVMSAGAPAAAVLAQADADFRDVLVAAFPAMDAEVDANQAAALNAPPPAPPDPNAKVFWRVKAVWNVDTDADGSPDWAEFEMQADTNHPSFALADAFNADVDNNGVADGGQLDLDGDQTPDAGDIAAADPVLTYIKEPEPRYAIFPITNAQPPANGRQSPLQINNQGIVLYENGVWSNGQWWPLTDTGPSLESCKAAGINDYGHIVGTGSYEVSGAPNEFRTPVVVYWSTPEAAPSALTSGNDYASPTYTVLYQQHAPGPVVSDIGETIASSFQIDTTTSPPTLNSDFTHRVWTLPLGGAPASKGIAVPGMVWLHSANYCWGFDPATNTTGKIITPGGAFDLPWTPKNVYTLLGGAVAAFNDQGMSLHHNGSWQSGGILEPAVDFSLVSGTAIGRGIGAKTAPILLNGKWQAITRTASEGLPPEWHEGVVILQDTTRQGWVLAQRGPVTAPEFGLMLPIRLEGEYENHAGVTVKKEAGVDDFSVLAESMDGAAKDRIWIMAPKGTSKTVTIKAPIGADSTLELTGPDLLFDNSPSATLSFEGDSFSIAGSPAADSGSEVLLDLKLGGNAFSASKPIGAKIMNARTVKVKVFEVIKQTPGQADNPPNFFPTEQALEDFLNDIFLPQVNVTFDVKVETTPLALNWDLNADSALSGNDESPNHSNEQSLVITAMDNLLQQQSGDPNHIPFQEDVTLFILGAELPISGDAWGISNRNYPSCWIVGDNALGFEERNLASVLRTCAHEIGHILVDYGHPDTGGGFAPLPGTDFTRRLMVHGQNKGLNPGCLLVKGEWDEAEEWMAGNIDAPQE